MDKQQEFVLRTLEERDIRFVRLWFTDVLGFLKSFAIPTEELEGAFDEGVGFDPSRLGDPLAPENLLRPNGRGIFYMRSFMDDITYGSGPGGGTLVTLRKRLTGPQADPSDPSD